MKSKVPHNVRLALSLITLVIFFAGVVRSQSERADGIAAYYGGDYAKAVQVLSKLAEGDTDRNQDVWLYVGMAQLKLKESKKAGAAFKAATKKSIVETEDSDEKVEILSKPRPSYTDLARMNAIQGRIKVALEFGSDGEIKMVALFQGLPHGLNDEVLKVVKNVTFRPAKKDGKAINAIRILEYNFEIY